jgi:hypothetical protein
MFMKRHRDPGVRTFGAVFALSAPARPRKDAFFLLRPRPYSGAVSLRRRPRLRRPFLGGRPMRFAIPPRFFGGSTVQPALRRRSMACSNSVTFNFGLLPSARMISWRDNIYSGLFVVARDPRIPQPSSRLAWCELSSVKRTPPRRSCGISIKGFGL